MPDAGTSSHKKSRNLRLWEVMAVSVAAVGPMLAMSGNAQGLSGYVGAAVPVVFLFATGGVLLIALGFALLSRHTAHIGSVYGLVGTALGPRAGMFSGIAILGAYVTLATCSGGVAAASFNSLLKQAQTSDNPFQLPWAVPTLVTIGVAAVLAFANTSSIARVLLVTELLGITLALVLAVTIFARGGSPTTGIAWSSLSLDGLEPSALLAAGVLAFLSWAGFEASTALGEESSNPKRNIPLALVGVVALLAMLYVFVMVAQVSGFGTDAAGLEALRSSGSTLGDLGSAYVGTGFSLAIMVTICISGFAATLACASAAGRIIYALARDGFGPAVLGRTHRRLGTPTNAIALVLGFCAVANTISWATGWPNMGTGNAAIDSYIFFASIGSVALLVSYLSVQVAAVRNVLAHNALRSARPILIVLPLLALGGFFVVFVLIENLRAQTNVLNGPATWGLLWCALGLALALFSDRTRAERIRNALRTEEAEPVLDPEPSPVRTDDR